MELAALLERKRKVILEQWFQLVIETYPRATSDLLAKRADQFRNPIGHTVAEGLGRIYEQIRTGMDPAELLDALDGIIRIRSIQDFTPAQAVSFVFDLKAVIREVVGAAGRAGDWPTELAELDSRVDRVVLMAFEKYTACREKLHEIRVNEIKKRMIERLQAGSGKPAGSLAARQSVLDEA